MNRRRPPKTTGLRLLGIVLSLGLLRVPLPQADYHNVRHHHAPGELCPHHDHLLRWHPSAGQNEDVALLHWHWFLPSSQDSGRDPSDPDSPGSPPAGLAVHAHLDEGLEPDWDGQPVIQASARERCPVPPTPRLTSGPIALESPIPPAEPPGSWSRSSTAPDPCYTHRAGLVALAQQRNC